MHRIHACVMVAVVGLGAMFLCACQGRAVSRGDQSSATDAALTDWMHAHMAGQVHASEATQTAEDTETPEIELPGAGAFPGVVMGVVGVGEPTRLAAWGVRKAGVDTPMAVDDRMHLGSCTKAMTAVLIGTLVDEGKLAWGDTLVERLPKLAAAIHPGFGEVQLRQLMNHQSGMPANAKDWWLQANAANRSSEKGLLSFPGAGVRFAVAVDSLQGSPLHAPGDGFVYSNLGYMVLGMVAEEATGQPWEALMQTRVFAPLGMASAGFGVPVAKGGLHAKQAGQAETVDVPWGHRVLAGGRLEPVQADNAPALGPAGTVHVALADWALFVKEVMVGFQAACLQGQAEALESGERVGRLQWRVETWRGLFAKDDSGPGDPITPGYVGGWELTKRDWAQGNTQAMPGVDAGNGGAGWVLTHAGSNTMWFAVAWLAPEQGRAILVATNQAGGDTPQTVDGVVAGWLQTTAKP